MNHALRVPIFFFMLLFSAGILHAQETKSPQNRLIQGKELESIITERTFWPKNKLDRFYFKKDHTFTQQLNDKWDNTDQGSLLFGEWEANNNQLCINYDEKTQTTFNLDDGLFCYFIYANIGKDENLKSHGESIHFITKENKTAFLLSRWMDGNYILDPAYLSKITKGISDMLILSVKKSSENETINRAEMTPAVQNFYDHAIGNIVDIADTYTLYNKNGYAFFTTPELLKNGNGDIEKSGEGGRWFAVDDYICAVSKTGYMTCDMIIETGQGLVRKHNSILGIHSSGFTRVYGENGAGFRSINDTPNPEFLKTLLDKNPK